MNLFSIIFKHNIRILLKITTKIFNYYLDKLFYKLKKNIFSLLTISALRIFCLNIISIFYISIFANAAELTLEEYASKPYGNVIFVRHALAPGFDAKGEPDKFNIDDCSTQRNLNYEGRGQAVQIGRIIKKEGIKFLKIYSSQ